MKFKETPIPSFLQQSGKGGLYLHGVNDQVTVVDLWTMAVLICLIPIPARVRESVLYSEQKKNTSIVVDDTSTGALQPGEANLTQAQTMDQFQEDKVRPGIVEDTYIDT